MLILDIDLDIFVSPIFQRDIGEVARPADRDCRVWSACEVRTFLEKQCGLDRARRVPGRRLTHHHELFDELGRLTDQETQGEQLNLVHVDAHADLGMRTAVLLQLCTTFLDIDPARRRTSLDQLQGQLHEGTWLVVAIACRMLSRLTYVHHRKLGRLGDISPDLFRDPRQASEIQLKRFEDDYQTGMSRNCSVLHREPPIPFTKIAVDDYIAQCAFDLVYLTHSPAYVPPAADELLDVVAEYIDEEP